VDSWGVVLEEVLGSGHNGVGSGKVTAATSFVVPDSASEVQITGPDGGTVTFSNVKLHGTGGSVSVVNGKLFVEGQFEVEGSLDVKDVELGASADLYIVQDNTTRLFPKISVSKQTTKPRADSVHVVMFEPVVGEQQLLVDCTTAVTCSDWLAAIDTGTKYLNDQFELFCSGSALVLDKVSAAKAPGNNAGVIAGVIVGVLVAIAVVIAIVIFMRKKAAEGEYAGMEDGDVEGYEAEEGGGGDEAAEGFESD
jgi:hypothetical protein